MPGRLRKHSVEKLVDDEGRRIQSDLADLAQEASGVAALSAEALNPHAPVDKEKLPIGFKVVGALCLVAGIVTIPVAVLAVIGVFRLFLNGSFSEDAATSTVITFIYIGLMAAMVILLAVFGIRLLRNKRRGAAVASRVLVMLNVATMLCSVMLQGISRDLIFLGVVMAALLVMSGYIDPSLSEERKLQRKLRDMDTRQQVEDGTIGLDETGKGFISLNFFNLFWIFVVCSLLGLFLETVYHFAWVEPGEFQDRAGVLFGPFSPIYGFGAVLMTIALNRFHDKPIILIFLASAVIGGAFEYATSWFMEFAFGAVAWDYTGSFMSIGGRTNGMFMAMWGCLGVVWIKVLLPWMLKLVNCIPWQFRYTITAVCAALMIVDGVMTMQSLDCWYQRLSGRMPDTPIEQFYDQHFDNSYMEHRFQSMTIHPEISTRTD